MKSVMADNLSNQYNFNKTILREYDIRGIVGETLSKEDAFFIGKGFATIIAREQSESKTICVGYDGRLSSPELVEALIEGIKSAGANVINIGLGPTPMLYFAANHFNAAGGIMVTGSHNPPTHNGFKMMIGKKSFFGKDIQKLGEIVAAGDLINGSGSSEEKDIEDIYISELAKPLSGNFNKDIKIAW